MHLATYQCDRCEWRKQLTLGGYKTHFACLRCSDIVALQCPRLVISAPTCRACGSIFLERDRVAFRDRRLQCPACHVGSLHGELESHWSVNSERSCPKVGDLVHGQVFMQGRFPQLRLFNEANRRARFEGIVPDVRQWVSARVLEVGSKTVIVSFDETLSEQIVNYALAWGA